MRYVANWFEYQIHCLVEKLPPGNASFLRVRDTGLEAVSRPATLVSRQPTCRFLTGEQVQSDEYSLMYQDKNIVLTCISHHQLPTNLTVNSTLPQRRSPLSYRCVAHVQTKPWVSDKLANNMQGIAEPDLDRKAPSIASYRDFSSIPPRPVWHFVNTIMELRTFFHDLTLLPGTFEGTHRTPHLSMLIREPVRDLKHFAFLEDNCRCDEGAFRHTQHYREAPGKVEAQKADTRAGGLSACVDWVRVLAWFIPLVDIHFPVLGRIQILVDVNDNIASRDRVDLRDVLVPECASWPDECGRGWSMDRHSCEGPGSAVELGLFSGIAG
ncbi:hypothetical protein RHS01_01535 [Rhizoctonia solani]|uniref:Uncharacterized protein n=1 Tax=Rhizoctonia solani TaxID=456999 RepID=A0A8H7IK65_9AGAM|nr:hypothetical protein RHS01_01535 [Rhizoctonia solani]